MELPRDLLACLLACLPSFLPAPLPAERIKRIIQKVKQIISKIKRILPLIILSILESILLIYLLRCLGQHQCTYFTEMCSDSEAGSYLRLIDFCITQL